MMLHLKTADRFDILLIIHSKSVLRHRQNGAGVVLVIKEQKRKTFSGSEGKKITMKNERWELNKNLAQMLKGGVIMDVTTPEQAKIAEAAGACAVMALERIPADI